MPTFSKPSFLSLSNGRTLETNSKEKDMAVENPFSRETFPPAGPCVSNYLLVDMGEWRHLVTESSRVVPSARRFKLNMTRMQVKYSDQ